jgi:integrase
MGRPRIRDKHLPDKVYRDVKSGMYYFVDPQNKYHRLGKSKSSALANYYKLFPHKQACVLMGALIDRYMCEKSILKAPSTHKDEIKSANHLKPAFGHISPENVTRSDVGMYIEERSKTAPVRVNREMSLLSEIFRQAPRWNINTGNPVAGIKRNNESSARKAKKAERYISNEQIEFFKTVCPQWLSHYIDLKLVTGLRQSAMLRLTTDCIQEHGFIVLDISKRGGTICFTWNNELRAIAEKLKHLANNSDGYLFYSESGHAHNAESFSSAWQRAMRKSLDKGLSKRFTERYLRNKAVTDCDDLERASKTIGHTSTSVTKHFYSMLGTTVKPFDNNQKEI